MEVDKVAVEVADMVVIMKVDKVADMLVKIPDEDYCCDWTLVILGDDARRGDGHGG